MQTLSLCEKCKAIDIAAYFRHATDVAYAGGFPGAAPTALNLGYLEDVYAREGGCALCRFLIVAIQERHAEDLWTYINVRRHIHEERDKEKEHRTQVYIYSYTFANNTGLDPSRDAQDTSSDTFRIGLAFRIQDDTRNSLDHVADIQLSASSAMKLGLRSAFHGRKIDPLNLDFALPMWWLEVCQHEHGPMCEQEQGSAMNNAFPEDMLVIDVDTSCICTLPPGDEYLALSYCWPIGDTFMLTKANSASLREEGALLKHANEIPAIIWDAMQATHTMFKKYLWVDALCIVQDDDAKKMLQIGQMDRVYSWATLTLICAPDIEQVNKFPLVRHGSRTCPQFVETVQGLTLMVPLRNLGTYLMQSRWDSRAWTFQEQKLSKRRLYFTSSQMYFECSNALFCEDTISEGTSAVGFRNPGSNLWGDVDNGRSAKRNFGQAYLSRAPYDVPMNGLVAYENLLLDYSSRKMTNEGDILNAFAGVIAVLRESLRCQFIYGLPERWMDHALLWIDTGPQLRRFESRGTTRTPLFPSWSWAGWRRDSRIEPHPFNQLIRPEIVWYAVTEDDALVMLDTSSDDYFIGRIEGMQEVKPSGIPPSSFVQRVKPRDQKFVSSQQWSNLRRLACWTSICSFHLSGDVYNTRTVDLGQSFAFHAVMIVSDNTGSAVGSIVMGPRWKRGIVEQPRTFEFILLSRSRDKTFVTEFDTNTFQERDWAYLNVMLIDRKDGIATRVGVGVVHEDAWINAGPISTAITLE